MDDDQGIYADRVEVPEPEGIIEKMKQQLDELEQKV